MKIRATFRTDRQGDVAEYFFEVESNPKPGTSGDLAMKAKAALDEFARKNSAFPLVNGGVWIKFDTVK